MTLTTNQSPKREKIGQPEEYEVNIAHLEENPEYGVETSNKPEIDDVD